MKRYAIGLAILAIVFCGRVLGQLMVVLSGPSFLPPMEEWYSGLIPYPVLFPLQLAILAFQAEMSRQLWFGGGFLTRQRPQLGSSLKWFALIYFLTMATRYLFSMAVFPERRWFGGTIPIVFHWVLAGYVYLLSRYHRGLSICLNPYRARPSIPA